MFLHNARRRNKGLWLTIALGLALYGPSAAQSLNGFGLPQPSQPHKYSAPVKPTEPEVTPVPESEKYIDQVRAVDKYLRYRYGFGFGDTAAQVRLANKTGLFLRFRRDPTSHDGVGSPPELESKTQGSEACLGEMLVTFQRGMTDFVSGVSHDEMFRNAQCSATDRSAQNERIRDEIAASQSMLNTLGVEARTDEVHGYIAYLDFKDPCQLFISIPIHFENASHFQFDYSPSKACTL